MMLQGQSGEKPKWESFELCFTVNLATSTIMIKELLHEVSFGSRALVILMFVALYYLRLRWKKEKRNKNECNNCHPQNNSQQMNRSCVIEIPRRSMDIAATDVSETTFSETTMRDFQNFLTFSRMMNSPPIMDNSDRPLYCQIIK